MASFKNTEVQEPRNWSDTDEANYQHLLRRRELVINDQRENLRNVFQEFMDGFNVADAQDAVNYFSDPKEASKLCAALNPFLAPIAK